MIIKQNQSSSELARKFASGAQLSDVRLAACRVWSQREWGGSDVKSEVTFKPSVPVIGEKVVFLPVTFSARMVDNIAEADIFGVECELEGRYVLRPDYQPTLEEVAAFQEANAVYHCWPFFREFVQSTSVRTGYPPVPVPLLMLAVEKPSAEKQPKRARALKAPSAE
jgi:hypothetical protein